MSLGPCTSTGVPRKPGYSVFFYIMTSVFLRKETTCSRHGSRPSMSHSFPLGQELSASRVSVDDTLEGPTVHPFHVHPIYHPV